MLYLPPGWAHDGVALDACMTYSIGFRAPAWQELGIHFLRFLEDRLELEGLYQDPELKPQDSPARIATDDGSRSRSASGRHPLERLRRRALPRPVSHRAQGARVLHAAAPAAGAGRLSSARVRRRGVALDLRSQMLYVGDLFFINGETVEVKGRARASLSQLADTRGLPASTPRSAVWSHCLHEWYGAGYLSPRAEARTRRRKP